jgi:hypothetical protein
MGKNIHLDQRLHYKYMGFQNVAAPKYKQRIQVVLAATIVI